MPETILLAILFFAIAALYGSVGHAGASGYLAMMALVGVAPERMKPTALVLNIVVATIATINFRRSGIFYPRLVLPIAVASVPMAFIGGMVHPSGTWYRPLVGFVLLVAAARAVARPAAVDEVSKDPRVPWLPAIAMGAAIGLLAGLTGTGGGVFLTPVVVFMGWATVRQSAGLSALFILVNSLAGLAGSTAGMPSPTRELAVLAVAAGAGGFVGSSVGASRLPERPLSIALAIVLVIAGAKLALS